MLRLSRLLPVAAIVMLVATSASAVTTMGFFNAPDTISSTDGALGIAIADENEDYGTVTGMLTATDNLVADITLTINPFLTGPMGSLNTIMLSYSVNGAPEIAIAITQDNNTGSGRIVLGLMASDELQIFVNGMAGPNGNSVTAAVATEAAAVPLPAASLLLLGGLAGFGAIRRRKSRS